MYRTLLALLVFAAMMLPACSSEPAQPTATPGSSYFDQNRGVYYFTGDNPPDQYPYDVNDEGSSTTTPPLDR